MKIKGKQAPKCADMKDYYDLCPLTIRSYYEKEEFHQFITYTDDYQVTVTNTIAIFDLSDHPIANRYKSAIFDRELRLVLSTQTTNKIINSIFTKVTVGGAKFQKMVCQAYQHKYNNGIVLGDYAFFAHRGYSNGNASWIGLHHVNDYEHNIANNKLHFTTHKLGEISFRITLHDVNHQIVSRLRQTLEHNITVKKIFYDHLCLVLNYEIRPKMREVERSLLVKCDLIDPRFQPTFFNMCKLVSKMCAMYIMVALMTKMKEFGVVMNESDMKWITRYAMRDRTNN